MSKFGPFSFLLSHRHDLFPILIGKSCRGKKEWKADKVWGKVAKKKKTENKENIIIKICRVSQWDLGSRRR